MKGLWTTIPISGVGTVFKHGELQSSEPVSTTGAEAGPGSEIIVTRLSSAGVTSADSVRSVNNGLYPPDGTSTGHSKLVSRREADSADSLNTALRKAAKRKIKMGLELQKPAKNIQWMSGAQNSCSLVCLPLCYSMFYVL